MPVQIGNEEVQEVPVTEESNALVEERQPAKPKAVLSLGDRGTSNGWMTRAG
jgi:hypothetical protein